MDWELDYKESWVLKNWCFWTVVLEKTLESPLDCKEIQTVHPKGDQSWIFIGRTDADAEAPLLWPPDVKSLLTGKGLVAGKDWRQEEKGTTEDETVRWHHWLNAYEFEQTLRDSEGAGLLKFMGSQRVRHDLATEQLGNERGSYSKRLWIEIKSFMLKSVYYLWNNNDILTGKNQSLCQVQISSCRLSLQGLNPVQLQLLTFSIFWKEFRV